MLCEMHHRPYSLLHKALRISFNRCSQVHLSLHLATVNAGRHALR